MRVTTYWTVASILPVSSLGFTGLVWSCYEEQQSIRALSNSLVPGPSNRNADSGSQSSQAGPRREMRITRDFLCFVLLVGWSDFA